MNGSWLALIIGNTRLHWGWFKGEQLQQVWHTGHLTAETASLLASAGFVSTAWEGVIDFGHPIESLPQVAISIESVWIASAVPAQTLLWVGANVCRRSHIPLQGLYPTLGIDRAINLLGAGETVGWPALVIDGGTALTFTAAVQRSNKESAGNATVYGGAILPGIRLQAQALAQGTAALGEAISQTAIEPQMPKRWATETTGAIASGLIYGITATIADYLTDWWQHFPEGNVVLTGGDGPALHRLLTQRTPAVAARVQVDSHLMFRGMLAYRKANQTITATDEC